jgi:hypothetical protein
MSFPKSERFKTYLFSYEYRGKKWPSTSRQQALKDAKDRLVRIARASYDGELVASFSVPLVGFVARLRSALWKRG